MLEQVQQTQPTQSRLSGLLALYKKNLMLDFRSPALWVFGLLYISALIYLITIGHLYLLLIALYALVTLGVTFLIVIPLTAHRPLPAWQEPLAYPRWKLWCQLVILTLYLFWVYILSYSFFLPWIPQMTQVEERSILLLLQVIIPIAAILLLGARRNEVALGRGFKSWRVAGALVAIPLVILLLSLVFGWETPQYILLSTLFWFLSAGIPEEVAFRGILMTRLARLFNIRWGIVLSSLLFCLIHFQVNQAYFQVTLIDAFAMCILFNMVVGLAFALVTQRTSNLLAGILFHTFSDALSFALLPLFLSTFK